MNELDMSILREWAEAKVSRRRFATDYDLEVARHVLATTTPPTMADVKWDDEVHAGLCALYTDGDIVIMLSPDLDNEGVIFCHYINFGSHATGGLGKENLTPLPGTKINLTPRREPESTPEPEQPQPEDVKPDPQPGEAWLIEFEGKRYEAIYWYSPLYAHWSFVHNREGTVSIESHEATPVSRLAGESTPDHPEFLETEEDYENAPEGTIVANDLSDPWVKDSMGFWLICGEGGSEVSRLMALAARRVLRWGETL